MRQATQTYPAQLQGDDVQNDERFVGELIGFANDLGQSFGWWEGSQQPAAPSQQPVVVNVPPPKDYTNVIVGVAAGLAAITILMIVLLKK